MASSSSVESTKTTVHDNRGLLQVLCGHACGSDNEAVENAARSASLSARYALIAVNQPMDQFFKMLWNNATVRVCADGGSNQVYDALDEKDRSKILPHAIIGDLDSTRHEVKSFYTQAGVSIIHDSGQDNTDLDKCLLWIAKQYANDKRDFDSVLVYPALGGRFDQQMAAIQTLAENDVNKRFRRLVLLSKGNSIELLGPGKHVIHCHSILEAGDDVYCGLLPMLGSVRDVTTTGLKWNLTNQTMKFGGLVSTSNGVTSGTVTVETSDPILWTITPGIRWPLEKSAPTPSPSAIPTKEGVAASTETHQYPSAKKKGQQTRKEHHQIPGKEAHTSEIE
jgi:thiamine pyrophosphokinase